MDVPHATAAPDLHQRLPRLGTLLALAGLTTAALWHTWHHYNACDDAFISYRYAENLVRGHGLVFNPGERVEGYTNFLWVMVLAAAHWLGASVPWTAQVLGAAWAAATVPIVYRSGRLLGLTGAVALAPCAVVAASAPVAFWAGAGLETAQYMALVTAALAVAVGDLRRDGGWPWSGPLFGLAALTRPEAAGLFAVACIWALATRQARAATLARMALGFALLVVPHEVFRLLWYGLPLPNTFYAKAGTGADALVHGLAYLGGFLWAHGPWALLGLIGLFARDGDRVPSRVRLLLPAAVLGAAATYIAMVGGDFYPYWRFATPYVPWLALLVCAGTHRAVRVWGGALPGVGSTGAGGPPRWAAPVATALVALSMALPARFLADASYRDKTQGALKTFEMLEALGQWLKQHRRPDEVMAMSTVGRVPYYSGLRTIDMLGITDAHIAHAPGPFTEGLIGHRRHDSDYILSRKPDLVILEMGRHLVGGDPGRDLSTARIHAGLLADKDNWWPAPIDLLGRRAFRLDYAPHLAEVAPGRYFVYFERDDGLRRAMDALPADATEPQRWFDLALLQRRRGLMDDAVASLRRLLALDPANPQVQINLGFFLLEAGRHAEAIATFDALRQARPELAQAAYGHAEAVQAAGRFEEAVVLWDAFLARFGGDHLALKAMRQRQQARARRRDEPSGAAAPR